MTYDKHFGLPPIQWNPFDDPVSETLMKDGVSFFGWIPPELRTASQDATDAEIVAASPVFQIQGNYSSDQRKVGLYTALRKIQGGQDSRIWQSTGSCVGAGGGNAVMTLAGVEIIVNGESEEWKMPWWLYTYGESRELAGMRRRGSGSFGSAWAKAASTKGTFSADLPGLPQYQMKGGWYWLSSGTELEWSDGQQSPQKWDEAARSHLVKTVAKARSASDIAAGIQNGYPATIASMFGTQGVRIVGGDNPVHLAEWDGRWAHQMYVDGWWDHPSVGEIFHVGNNWGPTYHGKPADDSPAGGFWITSKTLDRICQDDCWILSQYDGFPAQEIDWDPFS